MPPNPLLVHLVILGFPLVVLADSFALCSTLSWQTSTIRPCPCPHPQRESYIGSHRWLFWGTATRPIPYALRFISASIIESRYFPSILAALIDAISCHTTLQIQQQHHVGRGPQMNLPSQHPVLLPIGLRPVSLSLVRSNNLGIKSGQVTIDGRFRLLFTFTCIHTHS